MRRTLVPALCSALLFLAPVTGQSGPLPERQLRPGDAVRIEIKDEPGLSGEFLIGTDGRILLPLLGSFEVSARPFTELERELRVAVKRELVDPVLRITPLVRIAVLGEVRQPGLLLLDPTYTVADVLARAGGLTGEANRKRILHLRPDGIEVAHFAVDSAPLGATLSSGDQLVIERRSWLSENFGVLFGAVVSVGATVITALLLR